MSVLRWIGRRVERSRGPVSRDRAPTRLGEFDGEWHCPIQRVPDGGRCDNRLVETGYGFVVGIAFDMDGGADRLVPGVAGLDTEEGLEVQVTFDVDTQVVDADPGNARVGGVADREARSQGPEEMLDGVGCRCRATEAPRLIGSDRREVTDRRCRAKAAVPCNGGLPCGVCLRRVGGDRFRVASARAPIAAMSTSLRLIVEVVM